MKTFNYFLLIGVFLYACSTADQSRSSKSSGLVNATRSNVEPSASTKGRKEDVSLAILLRRLPGVQVSGNDQNGSVVIGSVSQSVSLSNQPLFVLDGVRIGHSLPRVANMVSVQDIDRITVLKRPSETSFYGASGANGVIVIKTKR